MTLTPCFDIMSSSSGWGIREDKSTPVKEESLRPVFAAAGSVVGVLVLFLGLAWLVQGNDFFLYKTFAPKYEQVRRETFEQSKAYNQGMVQELQNMQFEYVKADPGSKAALRKIILHRAADYPEANMPRDLAAFIVQLKREETQSR